MKRIKQFISHNKAALLAFTLCFLYIVAFSIIAINRYRQYEVFYYDFGIFDTAIWNVSQFHAPIIEHFRVGGRWIFADHFNPSIFLLSLLYWFIRSSEVILAGQAAVVGISGFVLFLLGKNITKNKLFSLGIMVSYILFIGIQNALISDFHEATIATLPLILSFFFLVEKKYWSYFLSFIIFLGCKESHFAVGAVMGITVFLLDRKSWKIGADS